MERVTALELEDEDGNVVTLKVRRVFAADTQDARSVRTKSLIVRPGGMLVASDEDLREVTTPDDAIADAHGRQEREYASLRERGLAAARTGGEEGVLPDSARAPASRPRRGSSVIGAPMEVPNTGQPVEVSELTPVGAGHEGGEGGESGGEGTNGSAEAKLKPTGTGTGKGKQKEGATA